MTAKANPYKRVYVRERSPFIAVEKRRFDAPLRKKEEAHRPLNAPREKRELASSVSKSLQGAPMAWPREFWK